MAAQEAEHAPNDLPGGVAVNHHVEGMVTLRLVNQFDGQMSCSAADTNSSMVRFSPGSSWPARPTPEGGFHGNYCHNDGYPAHQSRILFDAVTGYFDGDPDAACRYLIDQHPAGWSVLGGDFTVPPGYRTGHDPQDLRNQCYCHGDRQEPPRPPLTDHTTHDAWVDYAYVLEAEQLQVLTNRAGGWQPVAEPAWTERPDWDAIDQHAQYLRRGW